MKHYGDITKLHGYDLPPVDCITGGSPCQDLSVAGLRAGLKGERSGLFMEQIRIVKEMRERDRADGRTGVFIRPRYMVWENVPGAFSSNGGADFKTVIKEIVKVTEENAPDLPDVGKWTKSGCVYDELGRWSIAWRVHDAQFWGVPQRRKRIALVADFGGLSAPEVLFERKGLSGDFDESGAPGKETAGGAGGGTEGASGAYNPWDSQSARVYPDDGVWHSLNANENGGQSRDSVFCLQGNGIDRANTAGCNGKGWREDQCYTLNTIDRPAVYDARGNGDGKTVCTITGDHQNRVTDYTALCVGNGQLNQMSMAEQAKTLDTMHDQQAVMVLNDQGGSVMDVSHDSTATLRAQSHGHEPAVMISAVDCRNLNEHQDVSETLQCKENGGYSMNYQNPVKTQNMVRRLTPLECERLQGYPDGWTDIWEWTDSKGKKHKPSDSPRYKALGNSIALPFWFWLLRRISAQYIGPATLGSLFDGIGGFPLAWERCNGPGTAIFASEIEEFPIAVTKRHFPEDRIKERGREQDE